MTAQQLASRYGFQNTGALRTALSRARALIATDDDFTTIVETARMRLATDGL
jgi:hypothetical protein